MLASQRNAALQNLASTLRENTDLSTALQTATIRPDSKYYKERLASIRSHPGAEEFFIELQRFE
jgi:hypothetical protein